MAEFAPSASLSASEGIFYAPTSAAAGPVVSVVVVTYNGCDYIIPCLTSLIAGASLTQEIIVVDNRSTDGTLAIIRDRFPSVRVIENPENVGYGGAINTGSVVARGAYLAVLNQDAVVAPGWLGPLVAALEANPNAALANPKILLTQDPERINTCGNAVHFTGITSCRGLGEPAMSMDSPEFLLGVSGCGFLVRPSHLRAVGGFDEAFFLYLEDTDLSLRCALAGYDSLYVPDSVIYHQFKQQFSPQKVFLLERNRYRMLFKVFSGTTLAALAPALVVAEAVTWGFSVLHGPAYVWSKLQAYGAFAGELPRLSAQRQEVQRLRRVSDHSILERCSPDLDFQEAGGTGAARIAEQVFRPLFRALYRLALWLVR